MKSPLEGIAIDLYNLAVELDSSACSLRAVGANLPSGPSAAAILAQADADHERSRRLRWLSNNVRNAAKAAA